VIRGRMRPTGTMKAAIVLHDAITKHMQGAKWAIVLINVDHVTHGGTTDCHRSATRYPLSQ